MGDNKKSEETDASKLPLSKDFCFSVSFFVFAFFTFLLSALNIDKDCKMLTEASFGKKKSLVKRWQVKFHAKKMSWQLVVCREKDEQNIKLLFKEKYRTGKNNGRFKHSFDTSMFVTLLSVNEKTP